MSYIIRVYARISSMQQRELSASSTIPQEIVAEIRVKQIGIHRLAL